MSQSVITPWGRGSGPIVMGVLNVTPDSFSDGGAFVDPERAEVQARKLVESGASIVDVGGESTRPGSKPVTVREELRRVVPVLEEIAPICSSPGVVISIDTTKADVAECALRLGATMVNDVSALRFDNRMAEVIKTSEALVCLMHMRGTPGSMQDDPRYTDVVNEVCVFFEERIGFAIQRGISPERICIDPGIGFGKTVEHNLQLIRNIGQIAALGYPVVIGASRKSFLGRFLGDPMAGKGSLSASLAVAAVAYQYGARIFRVHDVREHVEALRVVSGVRDSAS